MSTATETPAQHGLAAHSHGAGTKSVKGALDRFASFDVADHSVPHGREEEWRFVPMSRLRGLHDDAALDGSDYTVAVDVDPRVTATSVGADDSRKGSSTYVPVDRPSARAWAAAEKTFTVDIPRDEIIERPSVIRLTGTSADRGAAGHLVITAGRHSKSVVVIEYDGSSSFVENVEVVAEDGAELTVVAVQDWADDAVHLAHHHVHVGRDATVKHAVITFGGDLVRNGTTLNYAGPGGDATLLGLYYADAGQFIENRLVVDHNTPNAKSDVEYKGALQGKSAHAVWVGDVLIRKEATGINTYELNRNLVLTDGARADSVPNLEIETGEIEGAGHASATGRFDDEQLFYLRARGIPEDLARKLVVRGFFASLINRIGVPEIKDRLMTTVERELAVAEELAAEAAGDA
ncbi:Fe-S cluster assembly protein SufD [Phytoactinopolyspora halotolerans]|uniref:Fe-S cluster assembly protein SufD n=1 Tax=Phytoactinopolyspora halotolerans TaxID=1981512 RepID=A0A6L9SC59_9ACTN|nr:Fe-S cluster assembly protein SufD [Phytoactinopolyspora halotolerans]NEE02151.1 Fe-S cluster assembly protein SufD [Phytoactinopolyspora halotolerans]